MRILIEFLTAIPLYIYKNVGARYSRYGSEHRQRAFIR